MRRIQRTRFSRKGVKKKRFCEGSEDNKEEDKGENITRTRLKKEWF